MNQKNSEGKRSARERLQEQRRKEEARGKLRRQAKVAGALVAVLAVGGGIAVWVTSVGKHHKQQASGPLVAPQGASGKDTMTIPVGQTAAKSTMTVYEDFRCPACAQFENGFRDTIHDLEAKGQLKAEYHLVTLIDKNLGGSGSINGANAAACAQDAGKFTGYHDVLYKNQPQETDDAYGKKPRLIQLAGQVQGLDTPAFRKCVTDGTHDAWVKKSNETFDKSSYRATPTVLINGKSVYGDQANPLTPDKLRQMIAAAEKG